MFDLINLTPHEVTIELSNGKKLIIPPSGVVARVEVTMAPISAVPVMVDGELVEIPVNRAFYGEVVGLPDPQPNTFFIVSSMVLQALGWGRLDVIAPDTSPTGAVRDGSGKITAVRGFQKF